MPDPTGTYRLQMHAGFGFAAAAEQVPYLARLGVSHLYLSPVLQATAGSMHGYDVVDHSRVSAELGGEAGLVELADTAHRHGLRILVDVVPNHMALVPPENLIRPLWEVLRDGRDAATAHWFDIDWEAGDGRLALPLLGDTLEQTLAAGDLVLDVADGEQVVRYFDHVFPVATGSAGSAHEDGDVGAVLRRQHYRLASWREKDELLNYRRFFDVDSLIAVRVEEPPVFEATHRVLLDLHARGVVDAFRIDHPDGLADPQGYLRRLHAATDGAWVLVEKILEHGESLPRSWPCAGTTGYDAMLAVQTALVDPAATPTLDRVWSQAGGEPDLDRAEEAAKRDAVDLMLTAEVDRLCRAAVAATGHPDARRLRAALVELLVAVDVYRAYVRPGEPVDMESAQRLEQAGRRARERRPDLADDLDLLLDLARGERPGEAAADFVVRFQQTCGPVMAKGIEDTTFYRWHRMVALNEVGSDPAVAAKASADAMHAWAQRQQQLWPLGMTTLSTHDTKRSEDVRARLLAAAQHPRLWEESSAPFLEAADEADVDRPTALLLWQTLLGAWPLTKDRLHDYLRKAMREAKQHTAWVDGDEDYERRVLALADRAQAPGPMRAAVESALAATVDDARATMLAAKLLQLCLPGVPDVYQGCELVTDSLVDPDNRRPVDFERRARLLARLDTTAERSGLDLDEEKLLVTSAALRLRRQRPAAFGADGSYEPLPASTEHATGFVRGGEVACVVTRAPARLAADGGWGAATVTLPEDRWTDVLTGAVHHGGAVRCSDLFATLPVALLERG
ncbi:MAG TPA: malto-oligosyltrehalose synthase [Nocardioidaceae bacterium]|nr:malto-oligosyltrehalose synthase [Nocardioidaceae bacterium]